MVARFFISRTSSIEEVISQRNNNAAVLLKNDGSRQVLLLLHPLSIKVTGRANHYSREPIHV